MLVAQLALVVGLGVSAAAQASGNTTGPAPALTSGTGTNVTSTSTNVTSTSLNVTSNIPIAASAAATSPSPLADASSTAPVPPPPASASGDLALIAERRREALATWAAPATIAQIPAWLGAQRADGTWADVDYRMGCDAQRANWPIQEHWIRVIAFAAAWSGLNPWAPANYTGDGALRAAALRGVDWWFANDYTNEACIGGTPNAACPCGTPGLWNTNWYGQVILIPQLVTTACALLQPGPGNLTDAQNAGCIRIPQRAYDLRDALVPGLGALTGANTVNVMLNSVALALFTANATMLQDALDRAMAECQFSDTPKADGIKRDGAFLQHYGILYNGNYGKDLLNAFIQLESAVTGTAFAASNVTREAVAALVRGNEWMLFRDRVDGRLKWDYNTIGRFIAFPTADLQASADVNINTTLLQRAVGDFSGTANVSDTLGRLASNLTTPLLGNRGFWTADYMVHRGRGFTLANKLISTRSVNNEYTNSANPFGYNTGQGTLFTYATGTEYKDIEAQWDWGLVPGTTVTLHAPPLNASVVDANGTREFVGVVSDGSHGMSVMDYSAPRYAHLSFRKAWFFLGGDNNAVLVSVGKVAVDRSVPGVGDAPVVSVLDNRAAAPGGIQVDGRRLPPAANANGTAASVAARTLLYAGNGYLSHGAPFALTLSEGPRSGNWSAISTSQAGVQSADIFSAYTTLAQSTANGSDVFSYSLFPGTNARALAQAARQPSVVPLDLGESGTDVLGAVSEDALAAAFFAPTTGGGAGITVRRAGWDVGLAATAPALVLLTHADSNTSSKSPSKDKSKGWRGYSLSVADPTQRLARVSVTLTARGVACPPAEQVVLGGGGGAAATCARAVGGRGVVFDITLPTGGYAGSSVAVSAVRGGQK